MDGSTAASVFSGKPLDAQRLPARPNHFKRAYECVAGLGNRFKPHFFHCSATADLVQPFRCIFAFGR
jgi:hypothetical protein